MWSDSGIVLSNRKYGENYKIVTILTKEHGKISALSNIISRNTFSLLSNVIVDLFSKKNDSLGFWKKKNEKQNWVYIFNSQTHLLVCQSICYICDKILPQGVKHLGIFNFLTFLVNQIGSISEHDAIKLYAYFEFLFLKESGFGFETEVCSICGKKENIHFISPKTGRTASKECLTTTYNSKHSLFEMPTVWKIWDKVQSYREILGVEMGKDQLKNSMNITLHFINQNILDIQSHFRETIISMI